MKSRRNDKLTNKIVLIRANIGLANQDLNGKHRSDDSS